MCRKYLKKRHYKRISFVLLEVLFALVLLSTFMPGLLKGQMLWNQEIKKLEFLNALENAFSQKLFFVSYDLQDQSYLKIVDELQNDETYSLITSKPLMINQNNYPCKLFVTKERDFGKYNLVSMELCVLDLPYKIKVFKNDLQYLQLPKPKK